MLHSRTSAESAITISVKLERKEATISTEHLGRATQESIYRMMVEKQKRIKSDK